ncbi:MAG: hypothetical protein DRJ13_12815 [Bacteroidetes bacterium]|nr:MAG: hypothetical protein DRJ13_12815 [Bacteroidota bacterium]
MALNLDVLTIIGIVIILAYLGSKGLSHLGLPQVVGFILVGVFLGSSFLEHHSSFHDKGIGILQ